MKFGIFPPNEVVGHGVSLVAIYPYISVGVGFSRDCGTVELKKMIRFCVYLL